MPKGIYKHKEHHSPEHRMRMLKTVGMIATLGNVLCTSQREKNDWKTRMLKAGLENKGLTMPEDWNTLDEATKENRLNSVIKELV